MSATSQNAPRGPYVQKPFRDALRLAVKRDVEDATQGKTKLDKIAAMLVTTASEGDVQAAKEIGDRLDGKVPQAVVGGSEEDNPFRVVHEIRRIIVKPGST